MVPHAPRPDPPPPPRAVPPDIDLGVAPRLLLWLGAGFTLMAPLLCVPAWYFAEQLWWMLLIGAVHGVAGLVLLAVGVKVRARRMSLSQHGLAALAHVVRVADHVNAEGTPHSNPRFKDVSYRYVVGDEAHGGSFTVRAPGPPMGAALWVIYDPAQPRRHLRFRE